MDELLSPVNTRYTKKDTEDEPLFTLSSSTSLKPALEHRKPIVIAEETISISSPEDALELLKSQPEYNLVIDALKYLQSCKSIQDATRSQISHVLVSEIALNYWTLLNEGSADHTPSTDAQLFTTSLESLSGINALLTQLRTLIQEAKADTNGPKRPDLRLNLGTLLDVLSSLLRPETFVFRLWSHVSSSTTSTKQRILAQQVTSMLGGGQLLQVAAEADMLAERDRAAASWVGSGKAYSEWLARNIVYWQKQGLGDDGKLCSDIFSRSLRLGYKDSVLREVFESLVLSTDSKLSDFDNLFSQLSTLDQKKILDSLFVHIATNRLQSIDPKSTESNLKISATINLVRTFLGVDISRVDLLINWLTSSTGAGLGNGIAIRRACVAAMASNRDAIYEVFEKSILQLGDQLYISHAPILQQECHAQVLILAGGYVFRQTPMKLKTMLRTGPYMQLVSNRLAASHIRVRILGMVVGEVLSGLVDTENTLNFHMEETNAEDSAWLKTLCKVVDEPGAIDPILQPRTLPIEKRPVATKKPTSAKPKPKKVIEVSKVKPIIEEIHSESEDEDLESYLKPDSDAEDSEEDATLVTRNKLKAPVYIRNLINYFRDDESCDKQKLALNTAATLIRRKANYGTEVSDHTEELATILVGINDNFEIENFHNLRLDALVALVVAQPKIVGPILARGAFEGDYSLAQRAVILSAIGMGVRELAGFDNPKLPEAAKFPSKRLPERMEQLYISGNDQPTFVSPFSTTPAVQEAPGAKLKSLPYTALDSIARDMTSSFIAPIAAAAADSSSGPDALKLSTLKGHITRKNATRPKIRSIPNTTAALIANYFFFPLTAHLQHAIHTRGSLFSQEPFILSTAIKTLAVLIYSAGPSTLSLPQMTSELWDLLLAMRAAAAKHINVAGALLTAMLAMLEVNENRMRNVCVEMGRQVMETQEWAGVVFGNVRGGEGAGEESRVKMMAAAVLIRLDEAVKGHQALLFGNIMGSM